jgi:CDGSH-type Zn-finger protein
MVTIKVRQNGPYVVDGEDVMLVDWNGAAYQIPKRPFALCRCGGSMTKPFCDGTHSKAGFKAAEAAVPGSQDKPATSIALIAAIATTSKGIVDVCPARH